MAGRQRQPVLGVTPVIYVEDVDGAGAIIDAGGGAGARLRISSGAVLALEMACTLPAMVARLALYEAPFVVDDRCR